MNSFNIDRKLAKIGTDVILKYRFLWVFLILLCVLLCGYGLKKLRLDSSNESFLPETDALFEANERFKEQFGNEEFVFILVETSDLFKADTLSRIRALQEDLEKRLPFVDEVNAISNIEYIDAHDDHLIIGDLISEESPTDPLEIEEIKRKLISSKLYINRIISSDLRYTGLAITFERIPQSIWLKADTGFSPMDQVNWPDEKVVMQPDIHYSLPDGESSLNDLVEVVDPRKLIAPSLNVILKNHQADDFKLLATGIPIADFEGDRITSEEGKRIGLIAMTAAFLFMLLLFRNLAGVIAPMIVMVFTVVILFGLLGWMNIPLSMATMIVAPLLMVLSVSYSIHYINHFNFHFKRKGIRHQALHYAYSQATWPCFLTALTTAVGFISFIIVSMKPIRDVGIACGAGVLISYLLVMILVPIAYSFGKDQTDMAKTTATKVSIFPLGMVPFSKWVLTNRIPIVLFSLITLVVGLSFLPKIPVETDFLKIMGEQSQFVRDTREITHHLGGFYAYEVLIELEQEGMAKDPNILKSLAILTEEIQRWDTVKNTMSLTDLIKELNYVMHDRNQEYYSIPESREMIAQYLLLYSISGGEELDKWIDFDYKTLRLSVQLDDSKNLESHINQMQALANELFPENTKIVFVGDIPIMLRLMNLLNIGQLKSIAVAFIFICIIMIMILKSFKAGLISMVPNLFPLVVIAGVMGFFQINLDIMTIMIAPMVIGIAVDDTVHFFIHFKAELTGFRDYERANQQTFVKIGYALLYTTIVLSLGFGILGFSSISGIMHVGFLSAIGILSALLADFLITPLLLVYLKPYGTFAIASQPLPR
ncbi:MMPL family transporter [bacterium]|nr:MMPL family transporter [bacterium]